MTLTLAATAWDGATIDGAVDGSDADAASFHAVRPRLFGIAYRVLGSATEADDVVQDTWIRWQGTDRSKVRDAAGFLATTTARLAINVRQSARARRETSIGRLPVEPVDTGADRSARCTAKRSDCHSRRTVVSRRASVALCCARPIDAMSEHSNTTAVTHSPNGALETRASIPRAQGPS
jgi:DNA-directed RNA polymerase specialized sigma24 family protein